MEFFRSHATGQGTGSDIIDAEVVSSDKPEQADMQKFEKDFIRMIRQIRDKDGES